MATKHAYKDYPYIRAYEQYMGAKSYYVAEQVDRAREANASPDVYRYDSQKGVWVSIHDMPNKTMQTHVFALAQDIKAK